MLFGDNELVILDLKMRKIRRFPLEHTALFV